MKTVAADDVNDPSPWYSLGYLYTQAWAVGVPTLAALGDSPDAHWGEVRPNLQPVWPGIPNVKHICAEINISQKKSRRVRQFVNTTGRITNDQRSVSQMNDFATRQ
jgi:hypothetical protein